uniref:Calcineurin-like phosphoesterase domain-containing protein n=1 Tax=candidate division WOR-3 bacterium TaxID=2052148 RepID=A0A7C4CBJ9_UNCW3
MPERSCISAAAGLILTLAGAASAGIVKGPYLQNLTDSAIVVRWETSTRQPGIVEYGLTTGYGSEVSHPDSTFDHELALAGLIPDTLYHYRTISGADTSSDAIFRSRVLPQTPFRFVVFGDPHGDSATNQQVANRMAQVNPEPALAASTGDLTGNGRYASWRIFFNNQRALLVRAPFFSAPGNHDYDSIANWHRFLAQPGNELYFSFRNGNASFHCLNAYDPFTPGSSQYNWFLQELQQDSANPDVRHIFVLVHTPPYSTNTVYSGNNLIRQHLCPLFERFGVRIVFSGHVHAYEHSLVNGVHYITTGGGGATLATSWNQAQPWTVRREAVYEFVVVDIDGATVTSRAIRANGTEFDTLVLTSTAVTENPPAAPPTPGFSCNPNPFRSGGTTITLTTPEPTELTVFDAGGRLAPFTITTGPRPGTVSLRPGSAPPGLYFCVVRQPALHAAIPLILTR